MSIPEITDRVNALGHAWEQFKYINDSRLYEIERKGVADGLYTEHLHRISEALDQHKSRLDQIETVWSRPSAAGGNLPEAHTSLEGYEKAFTSYLRKGVDNGLEVQVKALSVGSDPDGGYLVTPTMSQKIVTAIFETSPIRQLASVETISSDALEMLDDHNAAAAGWVAETGMPSETSAPQIAKRSILAHELYAQPKATQKLIDDSAINVEEWLARKVADIFGRMENAAFVNGTGVGQPRGFLTYAAGTAWGQIQQVSSGVSGQITGDKLIEVFYALKDAYMRRASFMMNRSVAQQVRTLKTSTNQYLWQPGLSAGAPDTLLGVPVYMASDMPVAASASLSVAVGDFQSAYQVVDRLGISVLRDPFTEKPFVKFYTTKRTGGDVVNFEAIKILKLS